MTVYGSKRSDKFLKAYDFNLTSNEGSITWSNFIKSIDPRDRSGPIVSRQKLPSVVQHFIGIIFGENWRKSKHEKLVIYILKSSQWWWKILRWS